MSDTTASGDMLSLPSVEEKQNVVENVEAAKRIMSDASASGDMLSLPSVEEKQNVIENVEVAKVSSSTDTNLLSPAHKEEDTETETEGEHMDDVPSLDQIPETKEKSPIHEESQSVDMMEVPESETIEEKQEEKKEDEKKEEKKEEEKKEAEVKEDEKKEEVEKDEKMEEDKKEEENKMDETEESMVAEREEEKLDQKKEEKVDQKEEEEEEKVDQKEDSTMEVEEEEGKDEVEPDEAISTPLPEATPRLRARPSRTASAAPTPTTVTTTGKRGRGRKRTAADTPAEATPSKARRNNAKVKLSYKDFVSEVEGDRVLSCGEGEQLGHPGRNTSKKPRKVDIVEDDELRIVQVCSGGVHSVILTADGDVYSCGINEKGTVPAEGVEKEGSTDEFAKIVFTDDIQKCGKIVSITAGASFTAALTEKGSVIAWGNLRDAGGRLDIHQHLRDMQDQPIVVIHHKKDLVVVKIVAGENHLVMLTDDGRVMTFGDGSMGQLGRSTRMGTIRSQYMAADNTASLLVHVHEPKGRKVVSFVDVFAGGFWTMMKTADNRIFACGLNNFGHLGIPLEESDASEENEDETTGETRELRVSLPKLSPALSGQNWTHIEGVQHIVARNDKGETFSMGKNTDNALGLGTWSGNNDEEHWRYDTPQLVMKSDEEAEVVAGTTAQLASSIVWKANGDAYSWGCDTCGQLGLGIKDEDEKIVPKPQKITSAHLQGFKIIQASLADTHSLFLAKKSED